MEGKRADALATDTPNVDTTMETQWVLGTRSLCAYILVAHASPTVSAALHEKGVNRLASCIRQAR